MENIGALGSGKPSGGKPNAEGKLRLANWLPCVLAKLRE